jgi:hypothetical protein
LSSVLEGVQSTIHQSSPLDPKEVMTTWAAPPFVEIKTEAEIISYRQDGLEDL